VGGQDCRQEEPDERAVIGSVLQSFGERKEGSLTRLLNVIRWLELYLCATRGPSLLLVWDMWDRYQAYCDVSTV
jgi:hypothetical protein